MKVPKLAVKLVTLLIIIAMLSPGFALPSAHAQGNVLTFIDEADSYVIQSHPRTNYGYKTYLTVDNDPLTRTYIRFNVSGLNGAAVSSAHLRLYSLYDSKSGFSVWKVDNNNWSETTLKFKNAPALNTEVQKIGAFITNQWLDLDVTGSVLGDGQITYALTNPNYNAFTVASRERSGGIYAPQLVLTTGSGSVPPPPTVAPTAAPTQPPAPTPTQPPAPAPTATPPPSTQPMPVGVSGSWKLIFDDEFNGSSLDGSKWITGFPWGQTSTTTPLLYYRPENVVVSNGTVKLIAKKESYQGKTYTSGIITTSGKFTHKYGFMEARLKVPAGQGLWPAFWNLPPDGKWPPEIDMMEILGNAPSTVHLHYHYGSGSDFGTSYTGPNFSTGFHTFAVDWEPDAITWYVDGVQRNKFTNTSAIAAEQMYLLLNLQVGGSWPGDPNSSTPFPSQYEIDYVRVWQK